MRQLPEHILLEQFRRFYLDTALSVPDSLPSLVVSAAPGHVVSGADNPYVGLDVQTTFTKTLDSYSGFASGQLDAINHLSAEACSPVCATGIQVPTESQERSTTPPFQL